MKMREFFVAALVVITAVSCSTGTSPDTGSQPNDGTGTIRIVSYTPIGPYVAGTEYDFTVVVAYTLQGASQAEIAIGFGGEDDGSSTVGYSAGEVVSSTATEVTRTYTFSETMQDAAPRTDIIDVALQPSPTSGSFQLYDWETVAIQVE
jgi:hypothetical protein